MTSLEVRAAELAEAQQRRAEAKALRLRRIRQRIEDGLTDADVARSVGCSSSHVGDVRRAMGHGRGTA